MNFLESVFLGLLQGLTEFLPVSSSGHLVLMQNILGMKEPALLFDTALHAGTLLAVVIYFRTDLMLMVKEGVQFSLALFRREDTWANLDRNHYAGLVLWTVVGTIPTAFIGVLFKDQLERLFASVPVVSWMLLVTGTFLFVTRWIPERYSRRIDIGLLTALAVGIAQGIAIVPGISRSGATIVCGLLLGLAREQAARYSFLLSIPAILGAVVLQLDAEGMEKVGGAAVATGFIAAAVVGLLALKLLVNLVRKGHLDYFAPYCWAVGLIGLLA
ncbi:MAG: undecaprenyl-diphosphate phosphatase [Desulfobacteraceae bacterium]|nr:MAG: undecaprenyl-diphosphate phosphatase [Desulfobacteraceae bacterium]